MCSTTRRCFLSFSPMSRFVILGLCSILVGCSDQNGDDSPQLADPPMETVEEAIATTSEPTAQTNSEVAEIRTRDELEPEVPDDLAKRVFDLTGKDVEAGKTVLDNEGHPTRTSFPDGSVMEYASGRPFKFILPSGEMTAYSHDQEGNLLRTVFPDGSSEEVNYDEKGKRIIQGAK